MTTPELASYFYSRIQLALNAETPGRSIRDFRVVLDSLFRYLTKEDKRTFSNLYARIQYVCDKLQIEATVQQELSALRILSNRLEKSGVDPTQEEYLLAIKTIAEAVALFLAVPVPESLLEEYRLVAGKVFGKPVVVPTEFVPTLKPVILEVHPLTEDEDGVKQFSVFCKEETLGEINVLLSQSPQNDLSILHKMIRPYDTVLLLRCVKVAGKENEYVTTPQSQVVLEPDLLIDISELAECFTNRLAYPLHYIVKKLIPQSYSESAFKGNMVNALLDAVIRKKDSQFIQVFKEAVADNVFQAASYGKETLNRIYQDITRDHWKNLSQVSAQVQGKPVRIEPSFFSSKFGIQGRLDVMVEDNEDENRKEIIELKSGRAPDLNTWVNHGMQVVGYNMLLSSTFGEKRIGSSTILYSASPDTALRNVSSNQLMENRLLAVRNEVVSLLLQLADGKYDCLSAIVPSYAEGLPAFAKNDYLHFFEHYSKAEPLNRSYYHHFLSFVIREYLNAKCGMYSAPEREDETDGFAALWLHTEDDKIANFSIIRKLCFHSVMEDGYRVVFRQQESQHHNFRSGDTVILYPRSNGLLEPWQQQMVKARIDVFTKGELVLSLNNHQLDEEYFSKYEEWVIEHDMYESTFWVATRSLFTVLNSASSHRLSLLMGERAPASGNASSVNPEGMNANQTEILNKALAAKEYFLLQGPPGTGKTSTLLTHLVQELSKKEGSIVIVAFTNRAVEEIAARLSERNIPFMRMGSRQSESEKLLRKYCEDGKIDQAANHIQSHRIFLGTVSSVAGRTNQLRLFRKELDTLIVDEASQLTEPQLISLVMEFSKFILIGDQNQLPPVVAQDSTFCAVQDPLLNEAGIADLRNSLFERLMKKARTSGWTHAYGMLTTHFRMHEDIAGLINHYYAHQLACGREQQREAGIQKKEADNRWAKILAAGRTIFVPSPRESGSRFHTSEADRVVGILTHLQEVYGADFGKETVGVVTPWRTQIGKIRSLLPENDQLSDLNIDTVERFQGSENDIIIVSMAVCHVAQLGMLHSKGSFGYTSEGKFSEIEVDRKLLVTLSRARKQVILLGDEQVLRASRHYARVLDNMLRVEF